METTGRVERRWTRHDFFLFRNDYLFVERNVFRVLPETVLKVDLGDTVRILHYPHTGTVQAVEVVARAATAERRDDG